ncbi:arylsulfatase B-like isoform X2 [Macrobrachium rosenbergii]|uniref:arylsulfatase B-like isoform X2 n=1 Tax=Macrobrachium rosenbergii TaxID=79674 RepID=UPI0034D7B187
MGREGNYQRMVKSVIWMWMSVQSLASAPASSKPHIIFLLADDLGWYDVSWHNPKAITPNLESLANEGIILEQSYVQPVCTPTRSALMTGRYPFTIGRQGPPLMSSAPTGLLLNATILPESLKKAGYSTHAVGKWHLGFCHWDYTPTHRGFDTFYGLYSGMGDHYNRDSYASITETGLHGYDFRNNDEPDFRFNGTYDTYVYADFVENLLFSRDPAEPMFLYMAFQSIHSPMQVPDVYRDPFRYIGNESREISLGMAYAMDDAIGRVVTALKATGHYENSVIVFSSDNGAFANNGNNWPLRGGKSTLWEGGTRAPGFIHSPLLTKTGFKSQTLFHVTDWYATLAGLAGGTVPEGTDGFDQWEALTTGTESPRTSFVYNLNTDNKNATELNGAFRKGEYKLLVGNIKGGQWIEPPEGFDEGAPRSHGAASGITGVDSPVQLYNVIEDPEERHDVADSHPEIVAELLEDLEREFQRMVPADNPPQDPSSDPKYFGGVWSPGWCDPH